MSMSISPEFIERYQIEYQKNPRSQVFAPLAEAYRKMGLLDEAYRICSLGVKLHPEFASGRVAFAKILLERKNFQDALAHLEKAVQISPDNLLAYSLLGETLIELRRPKEALKAYKMVLFINPQDEKALAAVRKWEFLTADEYGSELFEMKPVFRNDAASAKPSDASNTSFRHSSASRGEPPPSYEEPQDAEASAIRNAVAARLASEQSVHRELERALSLADAFTVRNDVERALEILKAAKKSLGPFPEINNRFALLARRLRTTTEDTGTDLEDETPQERTREETPERLRPLAEPIATLSSSATSPEGEQRRRLEALLRRVADRREAP